MKFALALPAVVLGAAFVALVCACAVVDDGKSTAEAKAPREYRTGSNIPTKDTNPPATNEERERAAEQIRALQRTGSTGKPKP